MKVLLGITESPAVAAVPKLAEGILNAGHKLIIASTEFPPENVSMNFFLKDKLKPWTDIHDPGGILDVNGTRIKILSDAGLCQCAILYKAVNVSQSWFDDIIDWPDVYTIAPLSIEVLAEIANGLTGNLVAAMARYHDLDKPLIVAPSVDKQMWQHPVTKRHLADLHDTYRNLKILNPAWLAAEKAAAGKKNEPLSPTSLMAPVRTVIEMINSAKPSKNTRG